MDKKETIYSVQVLRGIAAILVMLFHYKNEVNMSFNGLGDILFINGSIGVDLFFLISGFIVFYIANDMNGGVESAKSFLVKRLCRILPPYYIITLFVAGSDIDAWLKTIKSMLFIPLDFDFTGPVYGYAKLYVGWTLNYEFFFYSLSAICIIFKNYKWLTLTSFIIILTILPAMFQGWNKLNPATGYDFEWGYLKFMTNPIIVEFWVGTILGMIYTKQIKINSKIFWLMLLISSSGFFVLVYFSGMLKGNSPIGFMIPSALLLFSVIEYERRYGIKWPEPLLWLGAVSFSIYLIHIQSISLINKITSKISQYGIETPGVIIAIFSFSLTLLLAKYSHKYIEVKLSGYIRELILRNKKKVNIDAAAQS